MHEWGRTITGDNYARMPYGPVPSRVYDMLKSVRDNKKWRKNLKGFLIFEGNTIKPLHDPDMNKLSETDVKALQESFNERGHKSFSALKSAQRKSLKSVFFSYLIITFLRALCGQLHFFC